MIDILWQTWIAKIAADPEMDLDRTMRHVQAHIQSHMPNKDAPRERWLRWFAGTYNLLAILQAQLSIQEKEPMLEMGIARLFRHWETAATDHTPPPKGTVEICRSISSIYK